MADRLNSVGTGGYLETGTRLVVANGRVYLESVSTAAAVSPLGHQNLHQQYMAVATSRLNGMLQT
jgi:hypothetical protein